MTQRWDKPLYLMFKPPPPDREGLMRLCAMLGIEIGYAPERWHGTLLPVGETTGAAIDAVHRALEHFHAGPFPVAFDYIEGDTLKPRKGQRAPGMFQRMLARRVASSGLALPPYAFGLHLNLNYGGSSTRRARVPLIEWPVAEIHLVESGGGRHVHHGRWPLIDPQRSFDF